MGGYIRIYPPDVNFFLFILGRRELVPEPDRPGAKHSPGDADGQKGRAKDKRDKKLVGELNPDEHVGDF